MACLDWSETTKLALLLQHELLMACFPGRGGMGGGLKTWKDLHMSNFKSITKILKEKQDMYVNTQPFSSILSALMAQINQASSPFAALWRDGKENYLGVFCL